MKVIAFCPCDDNNLKHFERLEKSLRKFHSKEELPLIRTQSNGDPMYWYKATPFEGLELLKSYDAVLKLDADTIITGDLMHVFEEDFDIAVVQNSNPREFQSYPYVFMNINPLDYVNCGLVVMKSKEFVAQWLNLCNSPIFPVCQMREQDLLNILLFSGYKVRYLDHSDKWHGLISKGYWPQVQVQGDNLILPKNDEWPVDSDKQIVAIHFAGGNDPNKGNYNILFSDEVVERLNWLTK